MKSIFFLTWTIDPFLSSAQRQKICTDSGFYTQIYNTHNWQYSKPHTRFKRFYSCLASIVSIESLFIVPPVIRPIDNKYNFPTINFCRIFFFEVVLWSLFPLKIATKIHSIATESSFMVQENEQTWIQHGNKTTMM